MTLPRESSRPIRKSAAGSFVAGATAFLAGTLVIAVLGLRAADLATLALLAGGFVAGATAAIAFLRGALVIAGLTVGLRATDLATVGAFLAAARFDAVLADFFAADFFVVFFAAAAFLVFFVFFAIIVFPDRCG